MLRIPLPLSSPSCRIPPRPERTGRPGVRRRRGDRRTSRPPCGRRRATLVSDLAPEDFVVYEDGRPQKVTLFAPAAEKGEGAGGGAGAESGHAPRHQREHEGADQALPGVGDPLPGVHPASPRPPAHLLRPGHPPLALHEREPAGAVRAHPGDKGKGNTALYDAISVYLSRVADSGGRKVLLVFTDGEDSTSAIGLVDVLNLVRSSGVTIYPISFTAGAFGMGSNRFLTANAFLTQLADASGGQVFAPKRLQGARLRLREDPGRAHEPVRAGLRLRPSPSGTAASASCGWR